MFHIVLQEPEIPPNTGNIIRLCANSGAQLHLIHPLGFRLDDARLRRAGLDYREWATLREHQSFAAFEAAERPARIFALSTHGHRPYAEVAYLPGDALVFGPETRGLGGEFLDRFPTGQRLFIPMMPDNRSLNLSNAVALVLYEAWRQNGYRGAGRRADNGGTSD
jgi:tRNA (cytidine/uridine-2'-O-)-methyltransferase